MTFKMTEVARTITVYNYSSHSFEYIGASDAYIPPHTGLPAYCTDIEPPQATDGYVAVFDEDKNKWSLIQDHRGMTVYNTDTGDAVFISELGDLPENTTALSPSGDFKKWNGQKWVDDKEAKNAFIISEASNQKNSMLTYAAERIAPLQDAVELGIATETEIADLAAWRRYRVLLHRVNPSDAPDIDWPARPIV
ncbi:tail fiber assembly protein [Cronobacter sp. EKM101R]|uniref:tail fiber assembly protein n=1 Tax=Cronobacter TaxID=413496 RepID=UPI0013EA5419|nr:MULTISPECIES: tail fiber assembly protein [Cronobacter]KAF6596762.1 tail fiber assembly protein [Cronobacter sp. EKM101R]KAF6599588.1 tail fiber assembly protein [Cronobacter sp. EKM102R]MDK1185156.1 tail fiber assembly protein [Cronobacter turicensis]MDK1195287.1 tail fiber assembly protein [Cronobacter dublinensis]MDK1200430.1 tail fiber assembly protein [Cronobacter dublinensis]